MAKIRPELTLKYATTSEEITAAQVLRAETFGSEFGLIFPDNRDHDRFDAFCEHVLVYDGDQLVATTRMMDRPAAQRIGQFYTENEFELAPLLAKTTDNIVEVGRSCVHKDYRNMLAINTLWQGIGSYIAKVNASVLVGCASIGIDEGNTQYWLDDLSDSQKLAVDVTHALPPSTDESKPNIPPLLKAYVRMGSYVGATACYDPEFKCADVLIWFPLDKMDERYKKRFIGS